MLQRVGVGCVAGEPMHRAAEPFPVLPQERDALDENLAAVRARHHARGEVREGPEVVRAASLQERLAEAVVSVGYPHRHPQTPLAGLVRRELGGIGDEVHLLEALCAGLLALFLHRSLGAFGLLRLGVEQLLRPPAGIVASRELRHHRLRVGTEADGVLHPGERQGELPSLRGLALVPSVHGKQRARDGGPPLPRLLRRRRVQILGQPRLTKHDGHALGRLGRVVVPRGAAPQAAQRRVHALVQYPVRDVV